MLIMMVFLYLVIGITVHFLLHSTVFLVMLTFCGFSSYIPRYHAKELLFPTAQEALNKWVHFAIKLQKDSKAKTKLTGY